MDMINGYCKNLNAGIVYALDRRSWNNRRPEPGQSIQAPAQLSQILYKVFSKTPNIKRMIVASKDYQSFYNDLKRIKPPVAVAIIYKIMGDASDEKSISNILQDSTIPDSTFVLVKAPLSSSTRKEDYNKITEYWLKLEMNFRLNANVKDYIITEIINLKELMLLSDNIISNPRAYRGKKGHKIKTLDDMP